MNSYDIKKRKHINNDLAIPSENSDKLLILCFMLLTKKKKNLKLGECIPFSKDVSILSSITFIYIGTLKAKHNTIFLHLLYKQIYISQEKHRESPSLNSRRCLTVTSLRSTFILLSHIINSFLSPELILNCLMEL